VDSHQCAESVRLLATEPGLEQELKEATTIEKPHTQKSGKLVLGWAVQGDLDPATAVSNTYDMEWRPHSGIVQTFPEIDRVEWFHLDEARRRLKAAQVPFLDRLQASLAPDHTQPILSAGC
jgi:predicted NUDIX family NTP pyrophosphohydrolase